LKRQININYSDAFWVQVILPLAVPQLYTYQVPIEFHEQIKPGIRVEVPLRRKHYAAIVYNKVVPDLSFTPKAIIGIIDQEQLVTETQLQLWTWMSKYYCCSLGEVMSVAMPRGLKLNSETKILLNPYNEDSFTQPTKTKEYVIHKALQQKDELTLKEIQNLLGQKSVYKLVNQLIEKRLIYVKEELSETYKPKVKDYIILSELWYDPDLREEAFALVSRSQKQTATLEEIFLLSESQKEIPKALLYENLDINNTIIKALEKKGLIEIVKKEINRIYVEDAEISPEVPELTEIQQKALASIETQFKTQNVVLFHGVTGSGKTQVYIEMIRKCVEDGGQVLYLLPEIALTTQMLIRMQNAFGKAVLFFHSRMSLHEQVEVWQRVLNGHAIVLGARSSLLLPFQNLNLIIVDEEHDNSFKQQDPNPRYNARDVAIYAAKIYEAKTLLGTATPSLESIYNKFEKKYGYLFVSERFGDAVLPKIELIKRVEHKKPSKKQPALFSSELLEAIQKCVERKEQVILFQNRRGFAPRLMCFVCGWNMECPNCDVSLTTHKFSQEMRCHYCGYRSAITKSCPSCGNKEISLIGFGTEKVETQLNDLFPTYRIARMDHDTMRRKDSLPQLIHEMQTRQIDILIGTQMVTKGLDFKHVTLVGILDADALFQFPDFRAGEKAFQLLTQVSGRAGRNVKPGKVLIQTYDPDHWIIQYILANDYTNFARRELAERKSFKYPPFYRMIAIEVKHKLRTVAHDAANLMAHKLSQKLGKRVLGPAIPAVARIRNMYIMNILLKLEKKSQFMVQVKDFILKTKDEIKAKEGFASVRVNIDVDPL